MVSHWKKFMEPKVLIHYITPHNHMLLNAVTDGGIWLQNQISQVMSQLLYWMFSLYQIFLMCAEVVCGMKKIGNTAFTTPFFSVPMHFWNLSESCVRGKSYCLPNEFKWVSMITVCHWIIGPKSRCIHPLSYTPVEHELLKHLAIYLEALPQMQL